MYSFLGLGVAPKTMLRVNSVMCLISSYYLLYVYTVMFTKYIQGSCKDAPYFSIIILIIYRGQTNLKKCTILQELIPFMKHKSNVYRNACVGNAFS